MELYQIILLVLAAIVAGLYILKRVKGVDVLGNILFMKPVIAAVAFAVEAVCGVFPGCAEFRIVYAAAKAATEATEIAEKAWKLGNLPKDERNAFAKSLVKETLSKAGISVNGQIEAIINGAIEATCIILPHEDKIAVEGNEE